MSPKSDSHAEPALNAMMTRRPALLGSNAAQAVEGNGERTPSQIDLHIEQPVTGSDAKAMFGSDAVAEAIRALDIPYIALNPGASFRGLHDSLVNHLGNKRPQLLLCLHEEHAVAIAHGYAKVTGHAMAAAAHSNVGLFHATMAVFNAWCDRMPLLLLGATGPVDAAHRRPWIEWIHTARDQGAIVRGYTKWDDQPASPAAAREAILRAGWLAETNPKGPVYINLDVGLQEAPLTDPLPPCDTRRYWPRVTSSASAEQIAEGRRRSWRAPRSRYSSSGASRAARMPGMIVCGSPKPSGRSW